MATVLLTGVAVVKADRIRAYRRSNSLIAWLPDELHFFKGTLTLPAATFVRDIPFHWYSLVSKTLRYVFRVLEVGTCGLPRPMP